VHALGRARWRFRSGLLAPVKQRTHTVKKRFPLLCRTNQPQWLMPLGFRDHIQALATIPTSYAIATRRLTAVGERSPDGRRPPHSSHHTPRPNASHQPPDDPLPNCYDIVHASKAVQLLIHQSYFTSPPQKSLIRRSTACFRFRQRLCRRSGIKRRHLSFRSRASVAWGCPKRGWRSNVEEHLPS